jgi:hypothetical protein
VACAKQPAYLGAKSMRQVFSGPEVFSGPLFSASFPQKVSGSPDVSSALTLAHVLPL